MNTIFKPFLILTVLITVISAQNRSPSYVPPAEPMARLLTGHLRMEWIAGFLDIARNWAALKSLIQTHSGNYCGRFRIDNVATEIWHGSFSRKLSDQEE